MGGGARRALLSQIQSGDPMFRRRFLEEFPGLRCLLTDLLELVRIRQQPGFVGRLVCGNGFRELRQPAGASQMHARRVVLATGRDGLGGPAVPDFMESLDRGMWAHSSDEMNYARLAAESVC